MTPPRRPRTLPWHERRRRRRAAVRGVLATTVGMTVLVLLAGATRSAWIRAQVAPQPSDAVQVTALGLAALACLWLVVLLASATASVLPGTLGVWGRRLGAVVAPGTCARVAALLLGASLASGLNSAATAATVAPTATTASVVETPGTAPGADASGVGGLPDPSFVRADAADAGQDCLPDPGWRPARAAVRRQRSDVGLVSACRGHDGAGEASRRVVHRGDTLWGIAASALGPDASPDEIARAWPQWYAANRDVIGDDPDLLLPGQVLTVPDVAELGR